MRADVDAAEADQQSHQTSERVGNLKHTSQTRLKRQKGTFPRPPAFSETMRSDDGTSTPHHPCAETACQSPIRMSSRTRAT